MKKLLFVLALGIFAACNNGSTETSADSTATVIDSSADATTDSISNAADSTINKIDSTSDAKTDSLQK